MLFTFYVQLIHIRRFVAVATKLSDTARTTYSTIRVRDFLLISFCNLLEARYFTTFLICSVVHLQYLLIFLFYVLLNRFFGCSVRFSNFQFRIQNGVEDGHFEISTRFDQLLQCLHFTLLFDRIFRL